MCGMACSLGAQSPKAGLPECYRVVELQGQGGRGLVGRGRLLQRRGPGPGLEESGDCKTMGHKSSMQTLAFHCLVEA